jgi:hypothetical protein
LEIIRIWLKSKQYTGWESIYIDPLSVWKIEIIAKLTSYNPYSEATISKKCQVKKRERKRRKET